MSTPLIVLASILALFALVLIPLTMVKTGRQEKQGSRPPIPEGLKHQRKKKKR